MYTNRSNPRPPRASHAPRPRPGRRARRRAETCERLFRAALALFAEHGFVSTTVEDITETADVGKGTFFNYFPTKEHVLAAFGEMQVGKIEQRVAAARRRSQPTRVALRRVTHALAEEPGRSPALVRSLLTAVLASEPVRHLMRERVEHGRRLLAQLLALGQRRGEVRRDRDPLELAQLFQQTFFGTMFLWALQPKSSLAARLDSAFDLFWSGIAAPPARRRKR